MLSHPVPSRPVVSCPVVSCCLVSCRIVSFRVVFCSILSYPIPSRPALFHSSLSSYTLRPKPPFPAIFAVHLGDVFRCKASFVNKTDYLTYVKFKLKVGLSVRFIDPDNKIWKGDVCVSLGQDTRFTDMTNFWCYRINMSVAVEDLANLEIIGVTHYPGLLILLKKMFYSPSIHLVCTHIFRDFFPSLHGILVFLPLRKKTYKG